MKCLIIYSFYNDGFSMHKMRLMFKFAVLFSKHNYKFLRLKEIVNIIMPLTVKQKIIHFPPTRLWTKHRAALKDTAGYKMKIIYHFDRFLSGKSRFFFYLFATNTFDTKFDHFNQIRACRSFFPTNQRRSTQTI